MKSDSVKLSTSKGLHFFFVLFFLFFVFFFLQLNALFHTTDIY